MRLSLPSPHLLNQFERQNLKQLSLEDQLEITLMMSVWLHYNFVGVEKTPAEPQEMLLFS